MSAVERLLACDAYAQDYWRDEVRKAIAELRVRAERAEAEAAELSSEVIAERCVVAHMADVLSTALIPFGVRFMDPPDGGDVPLVWQVLRMASTLVVAEKRIADLEAENRALMSAGHLIATQRKGSESERLARALFTGKPGALAAWLAKGEK